MADVTEIPVEFRHKKLISTEEMYAQPAPTDEMIWVLCDYVNQRGHDAHGRDRCMRCPRSEIDPDYGRVQRGCYGLASEAARYAMAALKRFPPRLGDQEPLAANDGIDDPKQGGGT